MKTANGIGTVKTLSFSMFIFLCGLVFSSPAKAQAGWNAVWNSSGATIPSSAFIDATAFCHTPGACSSSTDDFCTVVFTALSSTSFPPAGGVLDARGLNSSNTLSTSCSSGSPFKSGSTGIKIPSTVLLPAGKIPLGVAWVLPNGTKIIGQGAGSPFSSSGEDSVTILQATSSFSGTMIQMGPNSSNTAFTPCSSAPAGYCTEVAVENLELVGGSNGANISGIINGQSQDASYVNKVSMYEIGGIGLKIWNSATNSGPYTDIAFNSGGLGSSSTECVELDVTTVGVHGLNCQGLAPSSTTSTPAAAVIVDAPNNTVKDVHIQGTYTDGIQIKPGASLPASSDVLFNVSGGSGVTNLVHIVSGTPNPHNISIMGLANGGSTVTLLDSVTSTSLNDSYIAMYVLGNVVTSSSGAMTAYSRFTTSTATVTWDTGTALLSSTSCVQGSLFSCTSGSSCTNTLYVCTASGWTSLP